MKDLISSSIVIICSIGLFIWLFSTLVPWWNETTGQAEIDAQAKLDAESCALYTPVYINKVLFCQCSDAEKQRPGKCNEKYK